MATSLDTGPFVNDGQASFAIAGKPAVGQELRVAKRANDPDGNGRFRYAWQVFSATRGWTRIGNGSRFSIRAQYLGQSLRLRTTYTDGQGFKESVLTSVGTIAAANQGRATFSIFGTPVVGQRLSAIRNANDPEGNGRLKHTWQASSDGITWRTVGFGKHLDIDAQHLGQALRVRTTYTDRQGFKESVLTSAGTIAAANQGQARFSITGTLIVGQELSVTQLADDPDGNGSFEHFWEASATGSAWTQIASGPRLVLAGAQQGQFIRVRTLYTDGRGFSERIITDPPTADVVANSLINSSSVLSGNIAVRNEVDQFSLSVAPGSIITASVESVDGGLYPLIELVDAAGSPLKGPSSYGANSANLGMYDLITGQEVINVKAQGGKTGPYSLTVSVFSREAFKEEVVRLTNDYRAAAGLDPLTRNPLLDQAAQLHVQDMDNSDRYLAHTGSNGSTAVQRIQATGYKGALVDKGGGSFRTIRSENAAAGQASPEEVVTDWMNSEGHKAAIMDPATKEIGVGFEYDNEIGRTYWIQNFGHPWSEGMRQWF